MSSVLFEDQAPVLVVRRVRSGGSQNVLQLSSQRTCAGKAWRQRLLVWECEARPSHGFPRPDDQTTGLGIEIRCAQTSLGGTIPYMHRPELFTEPCLKNRL